MPRTYKALDAILERARLEAKALLKAEVERFFAKAGPKYHSWTAAMGTSFFLGPKGEVLHDDSSKARAIEYLEAAICDHFGSMNITFTRGKGWSK